MSRAGPGGAVATEASGLPSEAVVLQVGPRAATLASSLVTGR